MLRSHLLVSAALSGALLVSACAGREARPIDTVKATDGQMSCQLMIAEVQANNSRARSLIKEKNDSEGKNVAVAVVGAILFWPALFAMDLKKTEEIEMRALHDRNRHLVNLMGQKQCVNLPPTSPAEADRKNRLKRAKEAQKTGAQPDCADVGGYETYYKETGNVCRI